MAKIEGASAPGGQARIEYHSNNSGGGWWLTDKDWLALEKAGWEVQWGHGYFCRSRFGNPYGDMNKPDVLCATSHDCQGHYSPVFNTEQRFLKAAATRATRYGLSLDEAKAEFAKVTKQDTEDPGCSCCGQPHEFYEREAGK